MLNPESGPSSERQALLAADQTQCFSRIAICRRFAERLLMAILLTMTLSAPLAGDDKVAPPPSNAGRAELTDKADAFQVTRRLGRGVNLGNALEAPREGQWGMTLEARYFQLIAEAGFDSVRLPVRWDTHAGKAAPYTIEAAYLDRVAWAVDEALKNKLAVVLNFHHHEPLYADPMAESERFVALWRQIAARFRQHPPTLVFELLNEPHDKLEAAQWNTLLVSALKAVREANPSRAVIIGPARWNNVHELSRLRLPADDRMLIVTVHYYEPFRFTHQGAEWIGPQTRSWVGTNWNGSEQERQAIDRDLDKAADWAKRQERPVYLGEFGAYSRADMSSRARWTRYVREQAEARHFAWAYWEFGAGFGAYDQKAKAWREPLIQALLPERKEDQSKAARPAER